MIFTLTRLLGDALSAALSEVFLAGFGVVVLALLVHLAIKEIPLRTDHAAETAVDG